VTYEEENIAWATKQFEKPVNMRVEGQAPVIELNPNVPDLQASDRERVLARYKGGEVKLEQLLRSYESLPPMMRPVMDTPAALKGQVEAVLLEPTMLQLALDRGIDRDPEAVRLIEKKREELLVEHLFQDSVQSKIVITPQMRKKYYEENKAGFITYPRVRFAAFSLSRRTEADSLKARLLGGAKAEAILLADSLAGVKRGSVQERGQNEHGPYHKVLFEELRPGQVTIEGPDRDGSYLLLQLLSFDPGHQLTYSEVERIIDESLQNSQGDLALQKFVQRHKKQYRVEAHPERVMQVRLVSS